MSTNDAFFVTKRNLRSESLDGWLSYAKKHAEHVRTRRDGAQVYYAQQERVLDFEGIDEQTPVICCSRW